MRRPALDACCMCSEKIQNIIKKLFQVCKMEYFWSFKKNKLLHVFSCVYCRHTHTQLETIIHYLSEHNWRFTLYTLHTLYYHLYLKPHLSLFKTCLRRRTQGHRVLRPPETPWNHPYFTHWNSWYDYNKQQLFSQCRRPGFVPAAPQWCSGPTAPRQNSAGQRPVDRKWDQETPADRERERQDEKIAR